VRDAPTWKRRPENLPALNVVTSVQFLCALGRGPERCLLPKKIKRLWRGACAFDLCSNGETWSSRKTRIQMQPILEKKARFGGLHSTIISKNSCKKKEQKSALFWKRMAEKKIKKKTCLAQEAESGKKQGDKRPRITPHVSIHRGKDDHTSGRKKIEKYS